jgi:hypothetical protein
VPQQGKLRRFKEFYDGAASWDRVERIIARVEAGGEGPDTRFVVTNLKVRNARALYEDVYCRRGRAENHIKSFKTHLAADRTSCTKATANQFRLLVDLECAQCFEGAGIFCAPVEAGARQQLHLAAIDPRVHAIAVEFDLMRPLVALRRLLYELA